MSKDDRELIEERGLPVELREAANLLHASGDLDLRDACREAATRLEALQAQPVGEIIAGLTEVQRAAIKGSIFVADDWLLTTHHENHPDIMEDLSEDIADPTSGILTPLGKAVRTALQSPPDADGGITQRLVRLRERLIDTGPKRISRSGASHEIGAMIAALTASPPVVEREAIARIIDPEAWVILDKHFKHAPEPDFATSRYRLDKPDEFAAPSLAKADAILALTPVEGVGDVQEALKLAYVTGFNDGWQDGNGEGDAVNTVCRGDGLGDFMSGITGLDLAALSTPVAQGDEVRDALEAEGIVLLCDELRQIQDTYTPGSESDRTIGAAIRDLEQLATDADRYRRGLLEIAALRLATDQGSLRQRADRMWEIAVAIAGDATLTASPPVVPMRVWNDETKTWDRPSPPVVERSREAVGRVANYIREYEDAPSWGGPTIYPAPPSIADLRAILALAPAGDQA